MVVCKFFQQGNCRYGHSCRFEHIYGSKYSYRAPQSQTTKPGNDIFANNSSSGSSQNSAASSFFRSAVQSIPTYENTFAHSQAPRPSIFDRLGPQQNAFNQNNEAKSIFASANRNAFNQPQTNNVFQNQTNNVFQTQTNNVFQTQTNNVFQTKNQFAAKSIFAQANQSIFGQQPESMNQETDLQKSEPIANVFQNSKQQSSFSTNVFEQNLDVDENIYSKLVELSQIAIDAFESAEFKLGFIPELPPPKSLCV